MVIHARTRLSCAMTLHTLHQWASLVFLLLSSGTALWLGGWPERVAGTAMVVAWFATAVLLSRIQLWGLETEVMIVDLALFLVVLGVALRSDRWWPLWAAAFLGLIVLVHFAVILDRRIWGRAYFVASNIFSYLTMLALIIGAVGRRVRQAPPAP
jgi:hypothetical protein